MTFENFNRKDKYTNREFLTIIFWTWLGGVLLSILVIEGCLRLAIENIVFVVCMVICMYVTFIYILKFRDGV